MPRNSKNFCESGIFSLQAVKIVTTWPQKFLKLKRTLEEQECTTSVESMNLFNKQLKVGMFLLCGICG